MNYKKMIPFIKVENSDLNHVILQAKEYEYNGADELYLFSHSKNESDQEELFRLVKDLVSVVDIPIMIGCYVERFEDIKKAFYTGASSVCLLWEDVKYNNVLIEGIERFGKDKIVLEVDASKEEDWENLKLVQVDTVVLNYVDLMEDESILEGLKKDESIWEDLRKNVIIKDSYLKDSILKDCLLKENLMHLLSKEYIIGVTTNYFDTRDLMKIKWDLKEQNIPMNTFESSLSFDEFKLNSDGMIPVVVQDYKAGEVLMVAYMNKEAYDHTIKSGKMTYYSRSRRELWIKGNTSGHFQYVKSLQLDCDKDTILAKVLQIGPACHTGEKNCFFTDLVRKEYDNTNPYTVFEDVYAVIKDRKENPKEGSYTNYLFDKGIDKILKKCGEEAAEIIIAAKNPDSEELKYEISDFLYHMMVLMAEKGLEWKDIIKELSHRR